MVLPQVKLKVACEIKFDLMVKKITSSLLIPIIQLFPKCQTMSSDEKFWPFLQMLSVITGIKTLLQ